MKKEIPDLDDSGLRRFALVFSAMVVGLFGVIIPMLLGRWSVVPWILALMTTVWGLVAPSTFRWFYRIWMRFGMIMHTISSPVILAVVYYFAIFPYGLVFRLLGKDPLTRQWDSEAVTYRSISAEQDPSHMEKPF